MVPALRRTLQYNLKWCFSIKHAEQDARNKGEERGVAQLWSVL